MGSSDIKNRPKSSSRKKRKNIYVQISTDLGEELMSVRDEISIFREFILIRKKLNQRQVIPFFLKNGVKFSRQWLTTVKLSYNPGKFTQKLMRYNNTQVKNVLWLSIFLSSPF